MTRPAYFPERQRVSVGFLDPSTGVGVADSGRGFQANVAGRRSTRLYLLADAAAAAGVTRVYLTGCAWPVGWFESLDRRPMGWKPGTRGHYADRDDPRLDLERDTPSGPQRVELRRLTAWGFPELVAPVTARDTFAAMHAALGAAWKPPSGVPVLLATPTATGQQLAALALPRAWDGAQLEPDLAELIRRTSPQHRIETPGACYGSCPDHRHRAPAAPAVLTYLDARFAYASLVSELGTAGVRHLTAAESTELAERSPYARARYRIRYTVPEWWEHPGLLLTPHDDGRHWHAPDLPGVSRETWADACEVTTARAFGWGVELLEGLAFTPGRPLDTWANRLVKLHGSALSKRDELGDVADHAARMLRSILLRTIGSFHSTGRRVSHVGYPLEVPPTGVIARRDLDDGRVAWQTRSTPTGAAAAWVRPELSSQVWARAHVRLAVAPHGAGFMSLKPESVWGVWGDALYLSTGDPGWADDGRPGRYRVKGTTTQPVPRPNGAGDLLRLRDMIGA